MELVQDLVWTASVALILSFFVAKLVAMAMADREQDSAESKVVTEEVRFEEKKLRVEEVYQSQKRVQFAAEVEAVDRFEGKSENEEAATVEFVEKSDDGGAEVSVEKAIDSDRRRGYEDEEISENRQVEESPESAPNDVVTAHCGEAVGVKLGNYSDEDDWEGIEKSELDEGYTAAVKSAPPAQGY
ncbi:acyl-CoA-binding domain-containing protein 3-like [Argentina anserina]|uniref:acyl-CoA-binding domain-containing protein 3-like n=1 Tax=Argentina anserina TaxID=57926 RepID=UPI002176225F|nr:acyl-CoA-binding domain-containing protein 3-like [Potentilla anserina]